MRLPTLTVIAALTLAGCGSDLLRVPEPPIGPQLEGEQIAAAFTGNSLVTVPEVVPPLIIYFGYGGDLRGLRSNNYKDSGTWRIEGGTVCGTWNNWTGTMANCWKVFRADDRITLKSVRDARTFGAGVVSGNPAEL